MERWDEREQRAWQRQGRRRRQRHAGQSNKRKGGSQQTNKTSCEKQCSTKTSRLMRETKDGEMQGACLWLDCRSTLRENKAFSGKMRASARRPHKKASALLGRVCTAYSSHAFGIVRCSALDIAAFRAASTASCYVCHRKAVLIGSLRLT